MPNVKSNLDVARSRGVTMDAIKNRKTLQKARSNTITKKPSLSKKVSEKKKAGIRVIHRDTFYGYLEENYLEIIEKAKVTKQSNFTWLFQ